MNRHSVWHEHNLRTCPTLQSVKNTITIGISVIFVIIVIIVGHFLNIITEVMSLFRLRHLDLYNNRWQLLIHIGVVLIRPCGSVRSGARIGIVDLNVIARTTSVASPSDRFEIKFTGAWNSSSSISSCS